MLQCQHLSEWLPSERERETVYPSRFFIFILLLLFCTYSFISSPFKLLLPTTSPQIGRMGLFSFRTWIITISFPLLSPVISSLPFLPFLTQTAPVSVGASCMIQQYPAYPSHSLLISLSLFPLLVIRGHVWLCKLPVLRVPHSSSHTSKNNIVNAFMFCEQIWFTSPLCLWIKHGSECKRGGGGSTWHNEVKVQDGSMIVCLLWKAASSRCEMELKNDNHQPHHC